jgi:hypothetical protein
VGISATIAPTPRKAEDTEMQSQIIVKDSGIEEDLEENIQDSDANTISNFSFPYRSPDWDFHTQRL